MNNWKAPGLDQTHGFWIKHIMNLHSQIAVHFQSVLMNGPPEWMTAGRTVLVVKDTVNQKVMSHSILDQSHIYEQCGNFCLVF